MSKSYFFFLSYFKYFKPESVECLNKWWHWAIPTLFCSHWLHIDVPSVWREGFPLNTPWLESSTGGQRVPFLGGEQYSFGCVGTRTVEKEMKYVDDLNKTLVNPQAKGGQRKHSDSSANSNLMHCQRVKRGKFWINRIWSLSKAENPIKHMVGWMNEYFRESK